MQAPGHRSSLITLVALAISISPPYSGIICSVDHAYCYDRLRFHGASGLCFAPLKGTRALVMAPEVRQWAGTGPGW